MVTTAGDVIRAAYRRARGVNSGDPVTPNLEAEALAKLQAIVLSLPGVEKWIEVDTDEDYTAGENERIRVTTLDDVIVTIPDAFPSSHRVILCCNQITLACEGFDDRSPKDGARVAISDQFSDDQAIFYFRADIAQWTRADGLTTASEMPLSADMDRYLIAMLAADLADFPLDPQTAALAIEGRQRSFSRYTQSRGSHRADYF